MPASSIQANIYVDIIYVPGARSLLNILGFQSQCMLARNAKCERNKRTSVGWLGFEFKDVNMYVYGSEPPPLAIGNPKAIISREYLNIIHTLCIGMMMIISMVLNMRRVCGFVYDGGCCFTLWSCVA